MEKVIGCPISEFVETKKTCVIFQTCNKLCLWLEKKKKHSSNLTSSTLYFKKEWIVCFIKGWSTFMEVISFSSQRLINEWHNPNVSKVHYKSSL